MSIENNITKLFEEFKAKGHDIDPEGFEHRGAYEVQRGFKCTKCKAVVLVESSYNSKKVEDLIIYHNQRNDCGDWQNIIAPCSVGIPRLECKHCSWRNKKDSNFTGLSWHPQCQLSKQPKIDTRNICNGLSIDCDSSTSYDIMSDILDLGITIGRQTGAQKS